MKRTLTALCVLALSKRWPQPTNHITIPLNLLLQSWCSPSCSSCTPWGPQYTCSCAAWLQQTHPPREHPGVASSCWIRQRGNHILGCFSTGALRCRGALWHSTAGNQVAFAQPTSRSPVYGPAMIAAPRKMSNTGYPSPVCHVTSAPQYNPSQAPCLSDHSPVSSRNSGSKQALEQTHG